MTFRERVLTWFRPAVYLASNKLSIAGVVLTTSSALTLVGFWGIEIFSGGAVHPYLGVILFLILPAIFVIGLLLIPIGALLRRQQLVKAGKIPETYPRLDFNFPMLRQSLAWVSGLTVANILILGIASYRGVEYMDSVKFCGQTCHTVMEPEYTSYQNSPHQRVGCVGCHIGPGAGWFVRSKLSGVRQVFAVTFHTYHQPIPSPVEQLRPARETCEQCHWPQKFTDDRLLIRTKFSDDEKNTRLTTVLVLKIGGRQQQGTVGIHGRHLDVHSRIEYVSIDRQRQTIPRVTYLDDNGQKVEFVSDDAQVTPQQIAAGEHRTMDCMDCHNRPTHTYQLPERAVDLAMAGGGINAELPFIKKMAVQVLKENYPDRTTATQRIASVLNDFYRTTYPAVYTTKRPLLDAGVNQVQAIYLRNIFPDMKVTWGSYPNNLGHTDFPGCFRCHDGSHKSADGRTIANDCDTCHNLLAMEDPDPKVLKDLGMK